MTEVCTTSATSMPIPIMRPRAATTGSRFTVIRYTHDPFLANTRADSNDSAESAESGIGSLPSSAPDNAHDHMMNKEKRRRKKLSFADEHGMELTSLIIPRMLWSRFSVSKIEESCSATANFSSTRDSCNSSSDSSKLTEERMSNDSNDSDSAIEKDHSCSSSEDEICGVGAAGKLLSRSDDSLDVLAEEVEELRVE